MKDFSGAKLGVELVDLAFEPFHLGIGDVEPRAARALALLGRHAKVGLDVEQVVLDVHQHRVERAVAGALQARHPDHRVDLVEGAVGRDAQIVFLAPLAGAERGGAVVAGARVDPVEDDHRVSVPAPRS